MVMIDLIRVDQSKEREFWVIAWRWSSFHFWMKL